MRFSTLRTVITLTRLWKPNRGYEMWTLKQKDIRSLKTAEMKFIRLKAGYSLLLDHRRYEDIFQEIKVDPVENKLAQYKQRCLC